VHRIGGLTALREHAASASPLGERLLQFFPRPPDVATLTSAGFWQTPFFAFLVYVSIQWWANKNADGGGIIIQRMASSKDERHALLATLWFNVAHYALRPWPWILVALASIAFYPDLADGEAAYPEMVRLLAPAGLLGLIVASFLAAFMSTIDSTLNLSSAYAVNDFWRRFVVPGASDRHCVAVSRIASVYFMVIASCLAVLFDSISGLFKFLLAFSSGVGLVYILRWFWWRINAWSEISAMIASSVVAGTLYLFKGRLGLGYGVTLLITVAVSSVVWVMVTLLTAPVPREHLVAFYRKVRPHGAWGPVAREAGVPPTRGLCRLLLAWLGGTVMVLAATFAIGKFLLAEPLAGTVWLAAAVFGAVPVALEIFRRPPSPEPIM
jgi:Na+/proline symporter